MVARPGRSQSAFTAGELDPGLEDNLDLKYRLRGLRTAKNIEPVPQGGFILADGMRLVADLPADACRILPFQASDGASYDLVAGPGYIRVYGESAELDSFAIPHTAEQLRAVDFPQQYDTGLLLHKDVRPKRVRIAAPDNWVIDDAPLDNLPTYDYGGTYTNGVSAKWDIAFVGLTSGTGVFYLTVSGEDTTSLTYTSVLASLATDVKNAIEDLPGVSTGITVTVEGTGLRIAFDGAGNEGDGWAVSGKVVNQTDAAVTSTKRVVGVEPGEDVISDARGWPRCGCFFQQRLLLGGFRSLPNAWLMSIQADYFNFDKRIAAANGSALVPMDTSGAEAILKMVAGRNLLIFTNKAEYWLQDRALAKTVAPAHVKASDDGVREGVAICENEGSAIFVFSQGSTIGEFAYTDTQGNFVANSLSILSAHLIEDIVGAAIRRPNVYSDGALYAALRGDGQLRLAKLLRSQDVTAFVRRATDGTIIDVACNGRNEISVIVERTSDTGTRRTLERLDPDFLLDCAEWREFETATDTISGLERHEGREVWVLSEAGDVFGPFTVDAGVVTLPVAVTGAEIGRWTPPIAELMPPTREIGTNTVLRRKGRIHSAKLKLSDTTSLAIGANGGAIRDVPLRRFGEQEATALGAGFTGMCTVRGLTNYQDEPTLVISQLRPGRLRVTSVTYEAKL